jgi:putative ABC transport system ATP-binding protein
MRENQPVLDDNIGAQGLARPPLVTRHASLVTPVPPAARAERLTRHYRRGAEVVRALDGVDLTIERGELAAIVGPSGSGKSTLMNLLGCMDRPTAGRLWIAGEEVAGLGDAGLTRMRRAHIGFIFQQFHLLPTLTVLENVLLPATFGGGRRPSKVDSRPSLVYRPSSFSSPKEHARELLRRVGLEGRLHHRPSQLSGGEMQRVAVARSLINDPELLLADEPTGNLDTEASAVVLDIIRDLNAGGLTVLLVTHNPELAACTRRVIRLRDGRIVEDTRI